MDLQVALEQSGSTGVARVRSACRAFPKEPGLSPGAGTSCLGPAVRLVRPLPGRVPPPPWAYITSLTQQPCLYPLLEGIRIKGAGR